MIPDFDNNSKNSARKIVLGSLPRSHYHSMLTLPGREALDVKALLSLEVLSREAEQTWVERDTSELFPMSKTRDRLYLDGEVAPDKINIIHTAIEDYTPNKSFDLVNLDLMSGITPDIGLWIERTLSRFLVTDATLIVTTTQWSRSPFCSWFHKNAKIIFPEHLSIIANHYSQSDEYAEAWVMLLMSALIGYDFTQIPILNYSGSGSRIPMITIRFDNISPSGPSDWPSFSEIVSKYESEVPLIQRQKPIEAIPDTRMRFNEWLAKSHMVLVREAGHENLYHYRDRVVKVQTFVSLDDAMRQFRRN